MSRLEPTDIFEQLEKTGYDKVREKLAQNHYGPKKRPLVEEWLRQKDAKREKLIADANNQYRKTELELTKKALRTNRIGIYISLIISLIAIGFSIFSYFQSRTENIIVRTHRLTADHPSRIMDVKGELLPAIIDTYWECILSNIGDRAISIIDSNVWLVENGGLTTYSKLSGGIVSSDGKALRFPFTIEPGHSKKFIFLLRPPLSKAAYNLLAKEYPTKKIPSFQTAYKFLAGYHIDFFGNSAQAFYDNQKVVGFRINSTTKQPRFIFKFVTSQGKSIVSESGWYSFPQY